MHYTTCAITGHRPTRFKWKYNENNTGCKRLKKRLREQFILLYEQGVRNFYVGGALGTDLWAGDILLDLKDQPEYSEINFYIALPFEGHNRDWNPKSKSKLAAQLSRCAGSVIVGTPNNPAVSYKRRNYYMVDHADVLLAVYDNDRSIRSGTGMTVNYARKKDLPIILIHPDTGVVTQL